MTFKNQILKEIKLSPKPLKPSQILDKMMAGRSYKIQLRIEQALSNLVYNDIVILTSYRKLKIAKPKKAIK